MTESAYDRLQRLEEESRAFSKRRDGYFYETDTPGSIDEHNRDIEIRRLKYKLSGREDPFPKQVISDILPTLLDFFD